jgi:hypothetical protein
VVQSTRGSSGHVLWVKKGSQYTLVKAAKLLIAVEPTTANMAPIDLDTKEKNVFSKLSYQRVHAAIVTHQALPVDTSLVHIPTAGAPANYMVLPTPNHNARFDYMGYNSTNWRALMVGDKNFDRCAAEALLNANFKAMRQQGTLPAGGPAHLTVKAWADHGAMHMHASASDIRAGFIQKQYELEGYRKTWWTGGAFSHQFQAILWAFDDTLLPKILA